MKKAPKNPPAESVRNISELFYYTHLRFLHILVKLLETFAFSPAVIVLIPKSLRKDFCVMVVPMKAES